MAGKKEDGASGSVPETEITIIMPICIPTRLNGKQGDAVQAGELLGYMGDSGYGPEGTTGEFPVHLHLGIYLPLGADQEKAVNPYWMLRYLESRKLTYAY